MPAPTLPPISDLILEWRYCEDLSGHRKGFCVGCEQRSRAYRLLVDWIRDDKFLGARIKALPQHLRVLVLEEGPPVPIGMVSILPRRDRLKSRPRDFMRLLVLAWCIRQADHERFAAIPKVRRLLKEVGSHGADIGTLLDLTYVPEESTEIISPLRDFFADERQRLRIDLLAHHQNSIEGRESELKEEIPIKTDQEKHWALQFGIDKKTGNSSRQIIWDWIFVPLTHHLRKYLEGRKADLDPSDSELIEIRSDIVFKRASTLVHLRYPHLWEDKWSRVRDRWRYYTHPLLPS